MARGDVEDNGANWRTLEGRRFHRAGADDLGLWSAVARCFEIPLSLFRYFVIYSFIFCHLSACCLCLLWFLLFASFKVSSFHFYSYYSGILRLFPLLSLIR